MDIMNAAGECKRLDQVRELARTPVSAITVGGITHAKRDGNQGKAFWSGDAYALNSLGLPNQGFEYYEQQLPTMAECAENAGKKLRINIAGFDIEAWRDLGALGEAYADEIEINVGCPNVWGSDGQKPIASFHPELLEDVVSVVCEAAGDVPCMVKLSPFSDPQALERIAAVLEKLPIKGVVTSNTFANAASFDKHGRTRISVGSGLAGMSGPALKPIALGQVIQLRKLLPAYMRITGVGGIENGKDVGDFLAAGADSVQVGTHYFRYGAKVFSEILQDYADYCEQPAVTAY